MCIHTAGQSGVQWRYAAPELARLGYMAIVPDLPGHGRSDPAQGGPVTDLCRYTAFCAALIDALGLERPFVTGCSIGGKITLDLAINHGHRLSAAVAMAADAGLAPQRGAAMAAGLRRELEDSAAPSRSERTYLGTHAVVGQAVPRERAEMIALMHRREDPLVSISDLIGWAGFDRWSRLDAVACPIHLAVGADDLWVDSAAVRRTVERIPGGRFTLLNGIGHYPMEEVPDIAVRLDAWFTEMTEDRAI
nr:alpha/beta hydrolase [Sinorhizobium mexicanum]